MSDPKRPGTVVGVVDIGPRAIPAAAAHVRIYHVALSTFDTPEGGWVETACHAPRLKLHPVDNLAYLYHVYVDPELSGEERFSVAIERFKRDSFGDLCQACLAAYAPHGWKPGTGKLRLFSPEGYESDPPPSARLPMPLFAKRMRERRGT